MASKQEKLLFKVGKGCLIPAEGYTLRRLRDKGFKLGDHLNAVLTKARNPKFNKYVHAFGGLVAKNIQMFEGMDAHDVLKRVQLEGNIECDEMAIMVAGTQLLHRIPRSLSFSSMDEGTFSTVFKRMCRFIADKYWKDLSDEDIEEMAIMMAEE